MNRVQDKKTPHRLSVVFLPPNPWVHVNSTPSSGPAASNSVQDHLTRLGVHNVPVNPTPWPWNPFHRKNPFLRGLDPCRAMKILLRHRDVDVIVSIFESGGLLLLLLRKLFRFKPKIVLWDASINNPWRVVKVIQKIVFPRYDGFLMLTSSQENHLKRRIESPGKVAKIYYNIDEQYYRPTRDPEGDFILAIGDDISRDYPTLLKAAQKIRSPIVIKSRWRPADSQDNTPANVRFVSDYLPREELRSLYARAQIIVLPLHEVEHAGGITAIFEAMAMGKPLVVSNTAVARDFVVNEVNALTVPAADPGSLAQAVGRLTADDRLRRDLGANARQHIENNFSSLALAKRMRESLNELCGLEQSAVPKPHPNQSEM